MNKLLEKSTQDFLSLYKSNLQMIGIPKDSPAEKMMITVLVNTAKQWSSNIKYNKALFGGKNNV